MNSECTLKPSPYILACRFPKAIIQHAIWLYLRYTLSLRDVEELLAERGVIVIDETIRVWIAHFGPLIARLVRSRRDNGAALRLRSMLETSNYRWNATRIVAHQR